MEDCYRSVIDLGRMLAGMEVFYAILLYRAAGLQSWSYKTVAWIPLYPKHTFYEEMRIKQDLSCI